MSSEGWLGEKENKRSESKKNTLFTEQIPRLKKHTPPTWLKLDAEKMEGTVKSNPKTEKTEAGFNLETVIEFYSR